MPQQQQRGLLRTGTEKAKLGTEETNDTVQSFSSCSQWNPAEGSVLQPHESYLLSQAKKKK